ncbi:aconitate hydratase [Tautonia marina]|uniref:aconitate hydratase n=1 Tax=Tautonia marina TaxID=2653855 RepID=UPI00126126C8|nr:aconitate hydratase [Tautonia marina]
MADSFQSRATIQVDGRPYQIYRLDALSGQGVDLARLPFSLKILLENLLRCEDDLTVSADDVLALAKWDPKAEPKDEIAFRPARVLMQDFTGVPAVVDLAAMRDAMSRLGGDPKQINPLQPAELVIDHSVQVDEAGTKLALLHNTELEYQRNTERYAFLRWGQKAFENFKVVPPETGIVHQVNLEYLARVVFTKEENGATIAYPDTLVGTDSHTTMINGLGVLGWGVGGIEAEAAMLGQPVSMLVPQVIGFKLAGKLPEGATATDLVLTVTQMLRRRGVVGKFVEFFGDGLDHLPLADRATIANMAPEYGATCGIFPIDAETLRYLELSGRPSELIRLVEAYSKEQGMFRTTGAPEPHFTDVLELDLSTVVPSLAGPKRPQDRVTLGEVKGGFAQVLSQMIKDSPTALAAAEKARQAGGPATTDPRSEDRLETEGGGGVAPGTEDPQAPAAQTHPLSNGNGHLTHGSVVIAAITSCTNTSNPSVMIGAGLVAKKAAELGLKPKPWVKASLAPGSKVVTDYLDDAGLTASLDALGFNTVGYGCTTCIGNSGPLSKEITQAIQEDDLVAVSVLSGNRNFEGRINSDVKANYLASPPLVVAYALAGTIDIDLTSEPIGTDTNGKAVYLKDIWPTQKEVQDTILKSVRAEMYQRKYADVFEGDERWKSLPTPEGDLYAWDDASTYVKNPPYFQGMGVEPDPVQEISGARVLAVLGDSITTDHISPAGAIKAQSPAGSYLREHGVEAKDFNSYGSRRGNHEVMVRGTFANVRLRNQLAPGTEGGFTRLLPEGEVTTIFDASEEYRRRGVPLMILAGKEYGSGSSRDWAAKGPRLLGVRAVIAESFERIHRSNLVGMGILPLQFGAGDNAQSLGLTGEETYAIEGLRKVLDAKFAEGREVQVVATKADGSTLRFPATVRIDTPQEIKYYEHGGILSFVLRQLLKARQS